METSVNYEDKEALYGDLVKVLHLMKLEEVYDPIAFGNYYITFSAGDFLIRYVNDRSQLFVYVASNYAPTKWQYLSVIKNYLNNAAKVNVADENAFSLKSILLLNDFLKNNFNKIAELLNKKNYRNTNKQIDTILIREFKANFPESH